MFVVVVMVRWVGAANTMVVKMYKAFGWHNKGVGERNAQAEYARMRREQPDSADARLSEAEFVSQYVGARPGMARYLIGGLLIAFVGVPASCAVGVMGSLN